MALPLLDEDLRATAVFSSDEELEECIKIGEYLIKDTDKEIMAYMRQYTAECYNMKVVIAIINIPGAPENVVESGREVLAEGDKYLQKLLDRILKLEEWNGVSQKSVDQLKRALVDRKAVGGDI